MRRLTFGVAALSFFAVCDGRAQNPPLPSAELIVAQYDDALGGRAAILRHTSRTTHGVMELHKDGSVTKVHLVYLSQAPFERLEKISLPHGGTLLTGFDGTNAWNFDPRRDPDERARLYSGDDAQSSKRSADFYYPLHELSWFKSAKIDATGIFEGRPCYRLHGINKWGKTNDHFYDRETHLLDGFEFASPLGPTHMIISDYRKIDGVLIPMKQTVKIMSPDGTWNLLYVLTFTSVTFNDVDPSVFTPPKSVRDLIQLQPNSN